jgi:hypothetical protein
MSRQIDFFFSYKNALCIKQVIRKNKIGNMPKEIAIYLNLLYSRADIGLFSAELQQHYLSILQVMLQLVIGIIKWNN